MPLFLLPLLSKIGNPLYKYLAIALLAVALFSTGFVKGLHYEHIVMEAAQKKAEDALIAQVKTLSLKLTQDAVDARKAHADELVLNSKLVKEVNALQKGSKKYNELCIQDEEVFKRLRQGVK